MSCLSRDFTYDLSVIKSIESTHMGNMLRIFAVLLPLCLASQQVYDTWFFVWWAIVYASMRMIWNGLLMSLPNVVGRGQFLIVMIAMIMMVLVTMSVTAFCFWSGEPDLFLIGLFGVILMALATLGVRADDYLLCVTYGLGTVSTLWLIPYYFIQYGLPWERAIPLVVMTALAGFSFLALLRVVRSSRNELRVVKEAEVARRNLASLGQLTGGVAHDFNNLLTVILGNLELFKVQRKDIPSEDRQLLDEAEDAGRRAADLTSRLLVFARNSALSPEIIDMRTVVMQAEPLLRRLLKETHKLELTLPGSPQPVRLDEKGLQVVLVNLVVNARDAMEDGGVVSLTVRTCTASGEPHVCLTVGDTGTGIPAHLINQVLEPYFTTKPIGRGTGLGLSMALGYAEQSGGGLNLSSTEGEGTEVTMWFPRFDDEDQTPDAQPE